ncbi:D-aminoacyl-tRNA deacylase [Alloiococcus sp. CFN-8]|uniref:D-aminoacyl-tRNA deacylase n=1 Tax=Alloiococcus sp. CFN-8 TaxID=3416081 RepID=UPI003CF0FC41
MRAVVQRVKKSSVTVEGETIGSIGLGFTVLLGIGKDDSEEDIKYLKDKITYLRVFEDEEGKMNLSLKDVGGALLVISQFTLLGDSRKGRRPNFMNALGGDKAESLYELFLEECKKEGLMVESGSFGAEMEVHIVNDGPVTILLDSKKTF